MPLTSGLFALALTLQTTAASPLPAPAELVASVKAHQQQIAETQRHYTWQLLVTDDELDAKGNITKSSSVTRESYLVHTRRYNRIIARDGVPLTPDEVVKETARMDKVVADHEAHPPAPADPNYVNPLSPAGVLKFCTVSNERWETRAGRPVVAMDFTGSPEVKGKDRLESAMKSLGGTMWIDPEAKQLVAMHIEVREDIHIGGGLIANFQKGSSFDFEQTRVHDQVWLPSRQSQHVTARILLVKGLRQDHTVDFSDYKEFKTGITILEDVKPVED